MQLLARKKICPKKRPRHWKTKNIHAYTEKTATFWWILFFLTLLKTAYLSKTAPETPPKKNLKIEFVETEAWNGKTNLKKGRKREKATKKIWIFSWHQKAISLDRKTNPKRPQTKEPDLHKFITLSLLR